MTMVKAPPKELKIAFCTPTTGIVKSTFTASFIRLLIYFLEKPVLPEVYTKKGMIVQMRIGSNIGEARDKMCDVALRENCSHVLFIDDDMGFSPDALHCALERQEHIVIANYRRKVAGGRFTSRDRKNENDILTKEESSGLELCTFGGFGFALISTDVLRAIPKPRFLMNYVKEADVYTTEDVPFYAAAINAGFKVWVDHDLSKRVWHCGDFHYCFDQDLDPKWENPYAERMQQKAFNEMHPDLQKEIDKAGYMNTQLGTDNREPLKITPPTKV